LGVPSPAILRAAAQGFSLPDETETKREAKPTGCCLPSKKSAGAVSAGRTFLRVGSCQANLLHRVTNNSDHYLRFGGELNYDAGFFHFYYLFDDL
jgi:hypothetical protein